MTVDQSVPMPAASLPAAHTVPVDENMRDFSVGHGPIRFRIDGDVFEGPAVLPAQTILQFSTVMDGGSPDMPLSEQIDIVTQVIKLFLKKESFDRFAARMADEDNPIGFQQVDQVSQWLMEKHGLRPTPPSGNSSDGQPNPVTGNGSMAVAPDGVSTPAPSPSPSS